MTSFVSYTVTWLVMVCIIGVFWYIVDRTHGVRWYRKWYKWTHKEPLPEGVEQGFIYGRKTRAKVAAAVYLSGLLSLIIFVKGGEIDLLVEFILLLLKVPCTVIGFAFGPLVYKVWSRRGQAFDTIDKVESGEIDITGAVKETAGDVYNTAKEAVTDTYTEAEQLSRKVVDNLKDKTKPEPPPSQEEVVEPEPELDASEMISQYGKKRRGGNK